MQVTAHSETGKIKSLFIKTAEQAFIDEKHIDQYWEKLNFLSKPDFGNALIEYTAFQSILESEAQIFSKRGSFRRSKSSKVGVAFSGGY